MPKKQFIGERFLDQIRCIDPQDAQRPLSAKMSSTGRLRANNSLAGIDFSHHNVKEHLVIHRRSDSGERRHLTPPGFQHLRISGIYDGPVEVKKHQIRVVSPTAAQRRAHIQHNMIATEESSRGRHGCGKAMTDIRSREGTMPFGPVQSANCSTSCTPARSGPPSRSNSADGYASRYGKKIINSPMRYSMESGLVPKEIPPSPRSLPEPLPAKAWRRCKRHVPEGGLDHLGEERNLPDYGHKALVGPPRHFEPAAARKRNPYVPPENLVLGSVAALSGSDYRPMTSQRSASSNSRPYDVISLLAAEPQHPTATEYMVSSVSPRKAIQLCGTPMRYSDRKNRASSPNILAWGE